MRERRIPGVERLEARETPDVSLGSAAACPPSAASVGVAAVAGDSSDLPQSLAGMQDPAQPADGAHGNAFGTSQDSIKGVAQMGKSISAELAL